MGCGTAGADRCKGGTEQRWGDEMCDPTSRFLWKRSFRVQAEE